MDFKLPMMDAGCGLFLRRLSRVPWVVSWAHTASGRDDVLCILSLRICCFTAVMPSFVLLAIFVFSRRRIRLARAPRAYSKAFALRAASIANVQ